MLPEEFIADGFNGVAASIGRRVVYEVDHRTVDVHPHRFLARARELHRERESDFSEGDDSDFHAASLLACLEAETRPSARVGLLADDREALVNHSLGDRTQ